MSAHRNSSPSIDRRGTPAVMGRRASPDTEALSTVAGSRPGKKDSYLIKKAYLSLQTQMNIDAIQFKNQKAALEQNLQLAEEELESKEEELEYLRSLLENPFHLEAFVEMRKKLEGHTQKILEETKAEKDKVEVLENEIKPLKAKIAYFETEYEEFSRSTKATNNKNTLLEVQLKRALAFEQKNKELLACQASFVEQARTANEKAARLATEINRYRALEAQNAELQGIKTNLEQALTARDTTYEQQKKLLRQETINISDQYHEMVRHNKMLVSDVEEHRELVGALETSLEAEKIKIKGLLKELDAEKASKASLEDAREADRATVCSLERNEALLRGDLGAALERNKSLVVHMQEMIENQSSVDGPKSDASDATAKDEIKVPEESQSIHYESDSDRTEKAGNDRLDFVDSDGISRHQCIENSDSGSAFDSDDSFETEINKILPERLEYIREAKREAKAKADADVLSQPAAEEPAHYASNGRDGPSDRGVPMDRVASNNLKSTGEEEIEEKIPAVSRSSSRSSIWDIDRERENLPSFKGIDMDVIKASSTALTRPECKEGDLPFHDDGIPVLKDKWVENRMMEIFRDMGAVPKKPGKTLYSRVTRTSAPGPFRPDYKQFDGTLQIGQFYANDAAPYPAINPPPKEKGSKYVDPEDVPRKRHPIHVPIYYNNEGIPPAPIKDDDSAQFMEQMKGTASVSEDSSITRFGIKDPFVRMGYPDRFEEIREVRVGPLPEQDVGVGSIFSQITSGQIDKVYCDRENNCISIVFVEPRAARKEYIRIFNHDIFILGSNEGYQCSEAHHTRHLLMKALPFIYTHRSAPMMPQFSKAVTNGLTRILVLTGNVKHITEAGLTKDIMCIIPGLNTPRDVIECIDISDSAGEVAINFMSLYYSAKVATTLVGTIGYKGLVFSYAQDTCDWLKLEKKEMMPRRPSSKESDQKPSKRPTVELEKALGEFAQESFFRKYVDFLELPNRSECEKLGIKWPTADKEAEEKAAQQKEAVENKQKVVKKFSKQAVTKQKAPETNTIQQNIFNKRLPTADQNVSKQQAIPDRALSPLQPEAVKMDLKGYMHYGNNNAKDMQENEVKTLLTQFADRGLVSESVLRENGVRPKWSEHKDGNEIEMVVDSLPNAGGNWAANEQNAIKAYRAAARPDEMVPRSPPVMLAAGMPYYADHIDASFDARMVHFVGLPEGLTYSRLCIYIKGGPVDSIHIEEDQHVATIVFLHTKDAVNYRRHMTANEYYIDGVRLIPSYSVTPRLANMRLWEPERVLREGISRCVFIEGLPNGTTEYLLKQDLRSLNPVVRIDFESIIVEGVCARIATPGVAMGNYVQRSIGMHPKYTGVRVRYEEDYSSAHISTVGKPFRR